MTLKTLFALVFITSNSFSQTAEDFSEDFPNDATSIPFDLAAWCDADGHRFVFEQTPLAEIIRTCGGHLERTGDAGAAVFDYFVNYTDGVNLITFLSDNDMGGPDHDLQSVAIRLLQTSDRPNQLPRISLPLRFPFGSGTISFPALTRKLGHAIGHNGVYAYTYSTKYKAHDNTGHSWVVDAYAYLEVRVRRGLIIALSVDHSSESE